LHLFIDSRLEGAQYLIHLGIAFVINRVEGVQHLIHLGLHFSNGCKGFPISHPIKVGSNDNSVESAQYLTESKVVFVDNCVEGAQHLIQSSMHMLPSI